MDEMLDAKEVLKLTGNISRATLTRWMDPDWAQARGLSQPFPHGTLRDGKTKLWNRAAVERWLEENAERLGRHPSNAPTPITTSKSIRLPLGKALDAARRATEEETDQHFDAESLVSPIEAALAQALAPKGVQSVAWNGEDFEFSFEEGSDADSRRVYFVLAYS